MSMYVEILIAAAIGYVLGSIPFALVIGKVFYKTDVREHGSGNLGGSNTGRVLGKKAGAAVMIGDISKVILAIFITSHFKYSEMASIWAGLAAAFGHCYPIFAGFKGGKAVATFGGFLIGISIFSLHNAWYVLVPLAVFLLVLYVGKMVALASICATCVSTIQIFFTVNSTAVQVASLLLTILIIYRHRANIERMRKGCEAKITWMG